MRRAMAVVNVVNQTSTRVPAVLGGVLSFFLTKDKARLGLALAALVMYGVCEFIATVICQGHLSAILAVFLGMLGLGMACGLALCSLGRRFAGRLAGR